MKILFPLVVFILSCSLAYSSFSSNDVDNTDRELNKAIQHVMKIGEDKFGLNPIGVGISSPNDVLKGVAISFEINHQLAEQKIKIILIELSKSLKDSINSSPILLRHMENPPFTLDDVSIEIMFKNKDWSNTVHPDFVFAAFRHCKFKFATNDPENKFKYQLKYEQDYIDHE